MDRTSQQILSDTLYLNVSTILARAVGLIVSIILARHLGTTSFGQLTLFFSIATIITTLSDIGILPYVIREVAGNRARSQEWFGATVVMKSCILLPIAIVLSAAMYYLPFAAETKIVIAASSVYAVGRAYLAISDSFFSAWEKFIYPALWELIFPSLILVITLVLLSFNALQLHTVLMTYIMAVFILFLFSIRQLSVTLFSITSNSPKPQWQILKRSYHFTLAASASIVLYQADILILRALHGPTETGYYGASTAIYSGLLFFIANMSKVLFPSFSRLKVESSDDFANYAKKILWLIFIFALPLAVGGGLLSDRIISMVYGQEYAPSAASLRFLLTAFSLQFVGSFFIVLLQSCHFQKNVARISWAATAMVVLTGVVLINQFSHAGAAMTRLLGNFLLLIMLWSAVNKNILKIDLELRLIKPIICSAAMAAFIVFLGNLHILLLIPSAAAVYAVSMIAVKGFSAAEYNFFKSFFFKKEKLS